MPDHEPACTGTYTCTRCGVAKPALAFPPNKQKVNGLDSWCRECRAERDARWHRRQKRLKGARSKCEIAYRPEDLPDGYE